MRRDLGGESARADPGRNPPPGVTHAERVKKMTTSTATMERNARPPWADRRRGACRGNWNALNVATMVLGFVLFWPIGLALVFWIASGRDVRELPPAFRDLWARLRGNGDGGLGRGARSDNVVFDEYQQAQYDRIDEIRSEIRERSRRFAEWRMNARRRADQEEFDRFMADSPTDESS